MPYIKMERREDIDGHLEPLVDCLRGMGWVAGDLNYVISMLCISDADDNTCYDNLNKIIGVLEAAKAEFYRTVVAPYEDIKITENGDLEPL